MDFIKFLEQNQFLLSPSTFAILIVVATGAVWLALKPTSSARMVDGRLDGYLTPKDSTEEREMQRPFGQRVLLPLLKKILHLFGRLTPSRNMKRTTEMLIEAGQPGGLTALDFYGARLLLLMVAGGGYFLLRGDSMPYPVALRNALLLAGAGYFLPFMWLRRKVRMRKEEITRALPDALDMMTIGVEAGLAFESAMLKVGDRWDNALARELRRTVTEMRMGTPRDLALERLSERLNVHDISKFVTVLIQSNQLGVSIAQALHAQADEMRIKRRQRAEEVARKAGSKMVFPLVFFFMPALFTVVLGPALPDLVEFMQSIPDYY